MRLELLCNIRLVDKQPIWAARKVPTKLESGRGEWHQLEWGILWSFGVKLLNESSEVIMDVEVVAMDPCRGPGTPGRGTKKNCMVGSSGWLWMREWMDGWMSFECCWILWMLHHSLPSRKDFRLMHPANNIVGSKRSAWAFSGRQLSTEVHSWSIMFDLYISSHSWNTQTASNTHGTTSDKPINSPKHTSRAQHVARHHKRQFGKNTMPTLKNKIPTSWQSLAAGPCAASMRLDGAALGLTRLCLGHWRAAGLVTWPEEISGGKWISLGNFQNSPTFYGSVFSFCENTGLWVKT